MTDTNRPTSFNVYDNLENKVIANYTSNTQATEHCWNLEPDMELENKWRYTVKPVRSCNEQ